MNMTLDDMLTKYSTAFAGLSNLVAHIQESGHIPGGELEGAPQTVEEAVSTITGMAFVTQQVINDLLEMKMSLVFEEAEVQEDTQTEVS